MIDEPRDESAGEQPRRDAASSDDQEPDAAATSGEGEPGGEATNDPWKSIPPEVTERLAEGMRAHLPDFSKCSATSSVPLSRT
jgi:hypothetical protein